MMIQYQSVNASRHYKLIRIIYERILFRFPQKGTKEVELYFL